MRRMVILTIAGCALVMVPVIAQNVFAGQATGEEAPSARQARPAHGQAERELQSMSETLNLTEEQKARIRPILQQRNQQLKDLRAKSSLPQGEARAEATQIRKSARRQIDQILTPEQREKQRAMRRGIRSKKTVNSEL